MRVTTKMLNESMAKAGLSMNGGLLEQMNRKNKDDGGLLGAVQKGSSKAERSRYEKQEKAADDLYSHLQKFLTEGKGNIFDKAEASGNKEDIDRAVIEFAEKYNSLLSEIGKGTNSLERFYKQDLKEVIGSNKSALGEIGISVERDGSLDVDPGKLTAATPETLKKLFGPKSTFASKLSSLADKIGDNAGASLESVSKSYMANGKLSGNYAASKYNFWG